MSGPPARRRVLRLCLAFAGVALTVTGCAGRALLDRRSDLELTWARAVVALPGGEGEEPLVTTMDSRPMAARLARSAVGRKLPVVLYLHGCTGIERRDFLADLARAGYAVIAPDSMARRFRPLQCDPETRTGGYNLFVYDFRQAEISYALQRMAALDWVDGANLFLVGVSEGGVAAALYRGDDFNARVIAQWTCVGAPIVRGIAAPPDTPILAIVRADDPWYAGRRTGPRQAVSQQGHCGRFAAGRPALRSIVIEAGQGHDALAVPGSVREIVDFLDRYRTR